MTKSDIMCISIDDIKDNKVDLKIKNMKLNKRDTIKMLYKYDLIKDGNIIISANFKVKIKLYKGMKQYIFCDKDITLSLFFYKIYLHFAIYLI